MKVILDTNIYSADYAFSRTEMIILCRLCNEEKIELLIPEVFLREFTTQDYERAEVIGKRILKDLNVYCNTVYGKGENPLLKNRENFKTSLIDANRMIKNKIDTFIKETKANILTPNIDDYIETFDRYFRGDKPFSKIKARNDIPDALAFVQIKRLKDNELIFISNDKKLREAVKNEGITVFSSLTDFISTDEIRKIIEINRLDDMLFYALPQIIENEYLMSLLHEALENELPYKTVTDEKIPDDNNEGTITGVIGIDPIEFYKDEISKHGSGLFTIPFYCEIDAYLEYYIFKADFYSLEEERISEIFIDDWNDHYYEAEEEYPLICIGELGMQFNSNISTDEIKNASPEKLVHEIKISLSELKITVKDF